MADDVLVPTLTGPVSARELGVTLTHEHLFVRSPELDRALPDPSWSTGGAVEAAVVALDRLADLGVETVVDLTVPGLGRDIGLAAAVAARTRVRIVPSTGWYTADVLPPAVRHAGPGRMVDAPDPLEELMLRDLAVGIEGTVHRAGMIKVVSDAAGLTEDVARVFAAAAHAHARTGVPLTTHSHSPSQGGLAQQDLLESLDVPLDRVVIGHAGDSTDLTYLRRLADRGSYLGFDRFGMEHVLPDSDRVRTLLALLDAGYGPQLLLSQDAAVYSRVTPPAWRAGHAPRWRLDHLASTVLPRLAREIGDDAVRALMVDNPRRLLTVDPDRVDRQGSRHGH